MTIRMVVISIVLGISAAVWIVRVGGPSERLGETWAFGLYALAIGVVLAEVIQRLRRSR
ncbi:MAG TPA: hypothetical protein VH740_26715 [Vicinamibacterales bacterium]|jgi:hypothetical protein